MRCLAITMLDIDQEPNQRIHYVVRMLEAVGQETVVVTKSRSRGRKAGALLRDALSFRVRRSERGCVTQLAVHPPLNYAHALAAGLVQGQLGERPPVARRAIASLLSLIGVARDIVLVPAFLVAILMHTRGRFDLCIAQGPWEAAIAWPLRALGRVRRLVYDDIDYVAGGQMLALRRAYVGWLERSLIARADAAMSTGWRLAALRERSSGRSVSVIPNGVEPDRFCRSRRAHRPTLVYSGNLAHYCGVDLALEALPRVLEQVPHMRLVVVGGGDPPYIAALHRLAREHGVERAVEIRGPVPYDALPETFAEADIGFAAFRPIPLRDFAFPLKVLEYLAAGLPVIGTLDSETADLLERFGCGRAIPFESAALGDAVLDLLADPGEYARMAEVARKTAQRFTWLQSMEAARRLSLGESPAPAREPGRGTRTRPAAPSALASSRGVDQSSPKTPPKQAPGAIT